MKTAVRYQGKIMIIEMPKPRCGDNEVLVQTAWSAVSMGTERLSASAPGGILKRILTDKNFRIRAHRYLKMHGMSETINKVLEYSKPNMRTMGYSSSGIVLEVGKNINHIVPGDAVACGGTGYAIYSEISAVPKNLICKIPPGVSLKDASFTTIASIALHACRRADVQLGDTVVVWGLGLLGQIAVQILKAWGCKVIGFDINDDRVDLAKKHGAVFASNPRNIDPEEIVYKITNGYGADKVILAASTKSSSVINQSAKVLRHKGKLVVLGMVGMDLNRSILYEKEIDVLMSTSYGPGRYDVMYEECGIDYPIGYVRWTENRNMEAVLDLMAEGKLKFNYIIQKVITFSDITALDNILNTKNPPLGIVIRYPMKEINMNTKIDINPIKKSVGTKISVGIIGSGGFVKSTVLPTMKKIKHYEVYAISSRTGKSASDLGRKYCVNYITTNYEDILKDNNIDMVYIATRHNLHTKIAIQAAEYGKAVFLEKPMAINKNDLKSLLRCLQKNRILFTVGFNRRYSPHIQWIKKIVNNRYNPMIVNYRMNAGYIPLQHWVHTEEGGGRNIGEACHIYDLFNFLCDEKVKDVKASSISPKTKNYSKNDNFVATITYRDGSVCNLIYTALGSRTVPKEMMDIYVDGSIISMNDYTETIWYYTNGKKIFKTQKQEKGHYQEYLEFAKCVIEGKKWPIPLWQLVQATEVSFIVENQLR